MEEMRPPPPGASACLNPGHQSVVIRNGRSPTSAILDGNCRDQKLPQTAAHRSVLRPSYNREPLQWQPPAAAATAAAAANPPCSLSEADEFGRRRSITFEPLTSPPRQEHPHHEETIAHSSSSIATSAITFHSSHHGRQRRAQRYIGIRDLQAAIKYGTRRPGRPRRFSGNPTSIYEYNGITYVVDDVTQTEITTYATQIRFVPYKNITHLGWEKHFAAKQRIDAQLHSGTSPSSSFFVKSHSVLLVDVSGSMRNSDVHGSRTRLGAVWLSIAQDYIAHRIETGVASDADIITIVLMAEQAYIHPEIENAPTDWVLYNEILRIYNEGTIIPRGHGRYRPALEVAEQILTKNDCSSCSLLLGILSDGRPSDAHLDKQSWEEGTNSIVKHVESLASKLGRRLTVATVGMGSANKFDTLRAMTGVAADFGSMGIFQLPSMTCSGLGAAVSSMATSLTQSQTEMCLCPNDPTRGQRAVRRVTRENKRLIPLLTEVVDKEEFDIYMNDAVGRMVFDPTLDAKFKKTSLQHPDARGVAFKKKSFGEGAERLAYQFFEVDADGVSVVGEPLVAKESRFVEDDSVSVANWEDRDKFVKRFCTIQHHAKKMAQAFNEKLDGIATLDPDTARVSFLDCSVYYLSDDAKGEYAVLVERRLEGKFQKWNSNNGWYIGKRKRRWGCERPDSNTLEIIKEEDCCKVDGGSCLEVVDVDEGMIFVPHDEVAQAFSHFSYVHSGRKMLICDLQGVYDRPNRMLCFTDPVIHYHDVKKSSRTRVYGRTDRGQKGIHDFMRSHECNGLCDLVTKGFITPLEPSKRQRSI